MENKDDALSRKDRNPYPRRTPPSPPPSRRASPPQQQQHRRWQHQRPGHRQHHQMERKRASQILRRSTTLKLTRYFHAECTPKPYLVDVLAFELGEELLQTLVISLNADGFEDSLIFMSMNILSNYTYGRTLTSLEDGELLPARPRRR